jgi:hypothetical protein
MPLRRQNKRRENRAQLKRILDTAIKKFSMVVDVSIFPFETIIHGKSVLVR